MSAERKVRPSGIVTDLLQQIAHTCDGVFAVDGNHRIIFWSKAAQALLGYPAKQVLGMSCHQLIQGRDCQGEPTCEGRCFHLEQLRRGRWVPSQDMQTRTKDGCVVWINMSTIGIQARNRKLSALIHIFREVPRPVQECGSEEDSAPDLTELIPAPEQAPLTRQERNVLRLLAYGTRTGMMAEELGISPITVRNHIQSILRKLKVHSRLEAVARARSSNGSAKLGSHRRLPAQ